MRRQVKPSFLSVPVSVGGEDYSVIVRVVPARAAAHVGADSPRYLDPGKPARVEILRILRGAVDVTSELTYWTRRAIETAVREETGRAPAKAGAIKAAAIRREVSS